MDSHRSPLTSYTKQQHTAWQEITLTLEPLTTYTKHCIARRGWRQSTFHLNTILCNVCVRCVRHCVCRRSNPRHLSVYHPLPPLLLDSCLSQSAAMCRVINPDLISRCNCVLAFLCTYVCVCLCICVFVYVCICAECSILA